MATDLVTPQRVVAMPGMPLAVRQILMLVALAGAVALGVMTAFWAQTPNYSLLYGNLSDKDTNGVLDSLGKASIPYKIEEGSGAILVPTKQVHEARLKLAGQGLPRGTGVGFEIMDDKPMFGNTQFQETARYQRAIEGELARSIMTMNNVQGARVHLAVPRNSAFVRDREQPSASVLLNLHNGRLLESDQVAAIVHLVASSVPNLTPTRVTVIDQKGKLLTGADSKDMTSGTNQLEYRGKIEGALARRVEELLIPITGAAAVKAQVTADLDFTMTETARESFNPQGQIVRSEQSSEELNSGGAMTGGVPGALSNQPPGAVSVPETTPPAGKPGAAAAAAPATGPSSSSKRATRNYEIDKTVSHVKQPTGTIKRLSVAVVVDDVITVDKKGKIKRTPRTPEEIARLTALAKEAVGFDEKRGDTVNVTNASFTAPPAPGPVEEVPIWKQGWVWDLAKQIGGGLLALVILLVVVKPLLKGLQSVPAGSVAVVGQDMAEDRAMLQGAGEPAQLGAPQSEYDAQVNNVRATAQQDPKRVAQVVKGWVGNDG